MSVSIFRRGLTALLVVAWIGVAISAAFAVIAPLAGQRLITSLPAATNHPRVLDLASDATGSATARFDEGVVALQSTDWPFALLKVADVAVMGALALLFLTKLRDFATDVSRGRPFTEQGALRFRRLGYILLGMAAWQVVDAVLWQWIVLEAVSGSAVDVVSTFAKAAGQQEVIRLIPDVSPALILAALVMLVFGKAISLGAEVQRDSDEIV